METRRQADRDMGERLAVMEAEFLHSGVLLNQIKKDVHEISDTLKHADLGLDRRVTRLELKLAMVTGAWFAVTTTATILVYFAK